MLYEYPRTTGAHLVDALSPVSPGSSHFSVWIWQIKKNDLPEIDPLGKESLNFQITILIITLVFSFFLFSTLGYGALVGSPWMMFGGGFGLGFVLALVKLLSFLFVVIASIKANNGELFHYPSIRFIK